MTNKYIDIIIEDKDPKDVYVEVLSSGQTSIFLSIENGDTIEELESDFTRIVSELREFRMKNFPESDNIE